MNTLDRELRRKLDKTVREARLEAETGARKMLEQLAVERHEPHAGMDAEARQLRNRLRAHGRQLGDKREPSRGSQAIDRLVRECAYEHWHRMLFARFLAESDLLIEPESGVPDFAGGLPRTGPGRGRRLAGARQRLRRTHVAADLSQRQTHSRASPASRDALPARRAAQEPTAGCVCGRRQPRLGLPVLAGGQEGRRQLVGNEDRRGRTAGGHPALHRGLYGSLPVAQHAWSMVGR